MRYITLVSTFSIAFLILDQHWEVVAAPTAAISAEETLLSKRPEKTLTNNEPKISDPQKAKALESVKSVETPTYPKQNSTTDKSEKNVEATSTERPREKAETSPRSANSTTTTRKRSKKHKSQITTTTEKLDSKNQESSKTVEAKTTQVPLKKIEMTTNGTPHPKKAKSMVTLEKTTETSKNVGLTTPVTEKKNTDSKSNIKRPEFPLLNGTESSTTQKLRKDEVSTTPRSENKGKKVCRPRTHHQAKRSAARDQKGGSRSGGRGGDARSGGSRREEPRSGKGRAAGQRPGGPQSGKSKGPRSAKSRPVDSRGSKGSSRSRSRPRED